VAAGLLAAKLGGPAEVRLHAPPPLATPMRVAEGGEGLQAWLDETLVLSARSTAVEIEAPRVDLDVAHAAGSAPESNPAPNCIVCGDEHPRGLRVFAGPVGDTPVVASEWTAPEWTADGSGNVRDELVWGVLDCPGSWSHLVPGTFPDDHFPALGTIAANILEPVPVGTPLTVLGWPVGVEGRKYRSATAILGGDGTTLAVSRQTCIAMPLDWAA
jgi:hypothetical protein